MFQKVSTLWTFFPLILLQSPTTVSWMDNTKLLGISTTTVKTEKSVIIVGCGAA